MNFDPRKLEQPEASGFIANIDNGIFRHEMLTRGTYDLTLEGDPPVPETRSIQLTRAGRAGELLVATDVETFGEVVLSEERFTPTCFEDIEEIVGATAVVATALTAQQSDEALKSMAGEARKRTVEMLEKHAWWIKFAEVLEGSGIDSSPLTDMPEEVISVSSSLSDGDIAHIVNMSGEQLGSELEIEYAFSYFFLASKSTLEKELIILVLPETGLDSHDARILRQGNEPAMLLMPYAFFTKMGELPPREDWLIPPDLSFDVSKFDGEWGIPIPERILI